jgi:thermitase
VVLRPSVPLPALAAWTDVVRDKTDAAETLNPSIDAVLRRHDVPVWVAMEYSKRGPEWSQDEIRSGLNRIYRLILQRDGSIPQGMLDEISLLPVVEAVRPGAIVQTPLPEVASITPRTSAARDVIGIEEAHAFTRGAPQVKIAVLDTGVEADHRELRGIIGHGYDFVDILDGVGDFIGDHTNADPDPDDMVGHGTHVAGIIAGQGVEMPLGVAPRCTVIPVRALAAMRRGAARIGAGLVDNINAAVKWAVDQDVDVINMSLGVRHEGGGLPHEEVVRYARDNGVSIVAASGNDGRMELYYPGALPSVIAVGAADDDGNVAPFSTYNDRISLIAPGVDVYSSYMGNGYAVASGTSQASPFVAGAAGLLKAFAREHGRSLGDRQLKHVLKSTADRIDARFKDPKAGFGMLNIGDAMRWLDYRYGT